MQHQRPMKIIPTLLALALLAFLLPAEASSKAMVQDVQWQKTIFAEIKNIENSFYQWREQVSDDELDPEKFAAMNDVADLKKDITVKFKKLAKANSVEQAKLRAEIKIALTEIRKKSHNHLE